MLLVSVLALSVAAGAAARPPWSVTVLGEAQEPLSQAVVEAVGHLNRELAAAGASLRLGEVTWSKARLAEETLQELSESVQARRRLRRPIEGLERIPGDLVIAFARTDLVSVGIAPRRFGRALVVLRPGDRPPLSLPNVARNVVTHELGHVLGLGHNANPALLMCGRPAPCRPHLFRSPTPHFFPLTDEERDTLHRNWR